MVFDCEFQHIQFSGSLLCLPLWDFFLRCIVCGHRSIFYIFYIIFVILFLHFLTFLKFLATVD
ncbi:hypothetical protein BDZ91DRAFT_747464, partial [Kalaharituber pfeilii]